MSSPRPINRIVIHTLAVPGTRERTGVEAVIAAWQTTAPPDHPASAHYLVDRDGTITQMVREDAVAFHAGDRDVNRDSLGVEHADVCNDPSPYTTALYERSAALVRDILGRFDLAVNPETVFGHQALGGHDDPGSYWDFEYYFLLLQWDGVTESTRPLRLAAVMADLPDAPSGWDFAARREIPDDICATSNDPYGARYLHADLADGVPTDFAAATAQFDVAEAGLYKISAWWPRFTQSTVAAATSAQILVQDDLESSQQQVSVDQRTSFGQWNDLGDPFNVTFPPATVTVAIGPTDDQDPGTILADAVRLLRIG